MSSQAESWERHSALADQWHVFVRPFRSGDEELLCKFLTDITAEDLRLRFFAPIKVFGPSFIKDLIHRKDMWTLVALDETTGTAAGFVQLSIEAGGKTGEYGILVRSDIKGRGLGWQLMQLVCEYGRIKGLSEIHGQILPENTTMIRMCEELGFRIMADPEDPHIRLAILTIPQAN